jgi:hypothetical protein
LPESPKTMATIHQRFLYSSGVSNMNIYCLRCFNSRH